MQLASIDLKDYREEVFCRMVTDGLALGDAYKRAGFTGKSNEAAFHLFNTPRIQERCRAILEARSKTAAVSLQDVTDMLARVYSKAYHNEEFNAAHNAAFSLARIYGHVTDRAQVEVLRKPSREPDAPAELSLTAWVAQALSPAVSGPASPFEPSPAPLLSQGPVSVAQVGARRTLDAEPQALNPGPEPWELLNENNNLAGPEPRPTGDGIGNGAPVGPVTGAPHTGGGSELLSEGLFDKPQWPKAEDLF